MNVKYGDYGGHFGLKWTGLIHTVQSKELKNILKITKKCTGSLSITPNNYIYAITMAHTVTACL